MRLTDLLSILARLNSGPHSQDLWLEKSNKTKQKQFHKNNSNLSEKYKGFSELGKTCQMRVFPPADNNAPLSDYRAPLADNTAPPVTSGDHPFPPHYALLVGQGY